MESSGPAACCPLMVFCTLDGMERQISILMPLCLFAPISSIGSNVSHLSTPSLTDILRCPSSDWHAERIFSIEDCPSSRHRPTSTDVMDPGEGPPLLSYNDHHHNRGWCIATNRSLTTPQTTSIVQFNGHPLEEKVCIRACHIVR